MTARKTLMIYLALLAWTLAPIFSVLLAGFIADLTGSTLNESGAHPFIILGFDIGGLLYSMFVFGWFAMLTLPTGGLALLIFSFLRPPITRQSDESSDTQ
jgi:hypothetical protein